MAYDSSQSIITITHDLATTGTKSCCVIARDLINKAGEDPETPIEFHRGTTPVFTSRPLRWWADRRVREADSNGPMRFEINRTH